MNSKAVESANPAQLAARLRNREANGRMLIGICGAPGAGKSTLAAELAARLNDGAPVTAGKGRST